MEELLNLIGLNYSSEINFYRDIDSTFHDHFPFIWNDYENLGYVTMYQEDDPSIAIFNYYKNGFRYSPTTFYGRPFWSKYYKTWFQKFFFHCKDALNTSAYFLVIRKVKF